MKKPRKPRTIIESGMFLTFYANEKETHKEVPNVQIQFESEGELTLGNLNFVSSWIEDVKAYLEARKKSK